MPGIPRGKQVVSDTLPGNYTVATIEIDGLLSRIDGAIGTLIPIPRLRGLTKQLSKA
jgi:hypothetical protein